MSRIHRSSVRIGLALALLSLAAAANAAPSIVLPRPGQVGIGAQGQFGTLLESGRIGTDYGSGPGLAVRMRYRMRYERALGLSFESQTFDAREARLADTTAFVRLNDVRLKSATLILSGLDLYQMFGTRTRTTKYLSAGIGLAQTSIKLTDGETAYPGDGFYLSASAGIEHFFWRSWAYDVGVRYLSVFQDGQANHDLQGSIGLVFYASY
jgi:hypothetical protein